MPKCSRCEGRKTKIDVDLQKVFSEKSSRRFLRDAKKDREKREKRMNRAIYSNVVHQREQGERVKLFGAN